MSDSLKQQIGEVLWAHQWRDGVGGCTCKANLAGSSHPFHVAEVLMSEMGLTEFTCGNERWWATKIQPVAD